MLAALPGPDLSPSPFRLSCGCRDQHEGESGCCRATHGNTGTTCGIAAIVWASRLFEKHSRQVRLATCASAMLLRSGCGNDRPLRRRSMQMVNVLPIARSREKQTTSHGLQMAWPETRFAKHVKPIASPSSLLSRLLALQSPRSYRCSNECADNARHPRFLPGRERRQSAALRRQRPDHAAMSRGYRSGRRSCFETPVAFSTRRTYCAGNGLFRRTSCHMLGGVHPHTEASFSWLPASPRATRRALCICEVSAEVKGEGMATYYYDLCGVSIDNYG
jgi:hypothetical protein